jgi:hypothetical protein
MYFISYVNLKAVLFVAVPLEHFPFVCHHHSFAIIHHFPTWVEGDSNICIGHALASKPSR